MRDFLLKVFTDDVKGPEIGLYSIWHILALLIILGATVFMAVFFRKADKKTKKKILDINTAVLLGLYFSDFFIHPLMTGENYLIVDKLPFHLCTSACILLAIVRLFPEQTKGWRHAPHVLGLIGAMYYIFVPTGIAGDKIFCYRSIQTLTYHGLLFATGVLSLVYEDVELDFKKIWVEGVIVVSQILISLFANNVYSTGDHHYDWYFTTGSSFGIPSTVMPFLIFVVFVGTAALIYLITILVKKFIQKRNA